MNLMQKSLTTLLAVFYLGSLAAQERRELEGTAIIGNKELPNVLYIVPWKQAGRVNVQPPPFTSVLEDVLQPIERSTFRQQVNYHNELYPSNPGGQ